MLTHFNLVANACQSVLAHPDIAICRENEGEPIFVFSFFHFKTRPVTGLSELGARGHVPPWILVI